MLRSWRVAWYVSAALVLVSGCDGGGEGADAGASQDAGDVVDASGMDAGSTMDAGEPDGGEPGEPDAGPPLLPPSIIAVTSEVTIDPWVCGTAAPEAVTATIENVGERPGTIVVEEGLLGGVRAEVPWFDVHVEDRILAPGERTEVVITPTPSTPLRPGTQSAVVYVGAAEGFGFASISVSMDVNGPYLAVSRSAQDFGAIPVGQAADVLGNISVHNQGNAPATIDVTPDFEPGFQVNWAGMPDAITLDGGGGAIISVSFSPESEGPARGTLAVSTSTHLCGLDADFVSAEFTGTGSTGSLGLSTLLLDFGTDECGAEGEPQTITLSNNGAAPITWTARLGGTGRFTLSSSGGSIAAGASTVLTVTPRPAPDEATSVPGDLSDTLIIGSSAPDDVPRVIPLSRSFSGARLRWSHTTAGTIVAPLGGGASTTVLLINEGSMPATVGSFVHPESIVTTPSSVVVPPFTSVPITVTYSPTTTSDATLTLGVAGLSGPICSAPSDVVRIPVRTGDALEVSPSFLSLEANCGGRPTGILLVSNHGTHAENATLTLQPGGEFEARIGGELVNETFTVPAGATTAIEVSTVAASSGGIPGVLTTGEALIETESGRQQQVLLQTRVHGAFLTAELVDPGAWEVPAGSWSPYEVRVTNHGDRPFMLQAFLPNSTHRVITVPPSNGVEPGVYALHSDVYVPSEGPLTPPAQVRFALLDGQSSALLCSDLPQPVLLRPAGVVGVLQVPSVGLGFGDNPCGGPAPPSRVLTLRNVGSTSIGYTTSLASGTYFAVSDGASGTIPSGGTALVTVEAQHVTTGSPGRVLDTLIVQSDVPGDRPRAIPLNMTVRGVVVNLPSSLALPSVNVRSPSHAFFWDIEGNVRAELAFDEMGSDPLDELSMSRVNYGVLGNEHWVWFRPQTPGTKSFTLMPQLPAGVPVCSGSLEPITVTGFALADAGPIRVVPAATDVTLTCGESPESYEFVVRNLSFEPIEFTLENEQGSEARWFASPASGTIPALGEVTISMIPDTPWPLPGPRVVGEIAHTVERWHERIALVSGSRRWVHTTRVFTHGHGYVLDTDSFPIGTGYNFYGNFYSSVTESGPTFQVAGSSTGGCRFFDHTPSAHGSCTSEGGTVTYTVSSSTTTGLCTPPGAHTMTIP